MADIPDGLWLCANPRLRQFDRPLFDQLSQHMRMRCWHYAQTADEPCSLEIALVLLHDYLKQQSQPVHLVGHGLSGIVGLLYAQRYPERVQSLTLLSVGVTPAVNWYAHYYALRELLPCRRSIVLNQMVRLLFGPQCPHRTNALIRILAKVLDMELTCHALGYRHTIPMGTTEVPLLVCHGADDMILDAQGQSHWQKWLKPSDRRWMCPDGRHFFHYEHPQQCGQVVVDFWQHRANDQPEGLLVGGSPQKQPLKKTP